MSNSKIVCFAIALMMIFGGLPFSAQDSGEATQDVGEPISSSGATGGLADSPWPMFRQNLRHTGLSPYDTSGNPGNLKWSYTTGDWITTSPAIGFDGTIYVGSFDNKLHAINPDGTEKWNFTTGETVYSSPAIDSDGTVYVGSQDDKLYAINPDGTQKWSFTTGGNVYSCPAISSDGTIYVGSHDDKLYAINPDGTMKWSFTTGHFVYSSPAIGSDGTVYVGSLDNKLYAINPDSTQKWSFTAGDHVHSSPAISSDGTIYVGSTDDKLYAINPDGTQKWNFTTGSRVRSSPAIGSDGTIYVGSHDSKLYAINPDGTQKWNFTTGCCVPSSPAIGSDGTIYVGSEDDKLYAINPDGTEKWSYTTGDRVWSSPAIGSDGTIYIGSEDHKLYAIGTPSQNQPPVADAGPDQTTLEGSVVLFDGSNSKGSANGPGHVWTKYTDNPVLDLGPPGSWDDAYVTHPSVLYDGTTYQMWYSGYDSSSWRIGYAYSSDGITWTKSPSNPVLDLGASGSWEDTHVTHPTVLYDGTKYHMWYSGLDGGNYRIGYASSSDGITWVKYSGNPVLDWGPPGSWDDSRVDVPMVIYDGTTFQMWYSGNDGSRFRIGYASSSDGTTWFKSATNPVLDLAPWGSWDDYHVYSPSIIYDGITYYMWYSGHDGSNWRIGTATSFDGITWTKDITNPLLDIGPPGSWEDVGVHSPTVLYIGESYHMWYRGYSGTNVRIGYAYSTPGGEAPITSYEWDFDADFDSDGDGDPTNDVDATGPTPTHVYGDDGVYEVTLTVKTSVEGGTVVEADRDIVFCIDSTGSMGPPSNNDPTRLRVTESQNFVTNHLKEPDRAAVVDFDTDAWLVPWGWPTGDHLSSDYAQIIANLDQIDNAGGTIVSNGLNLSIRELVQYGDPNHVPVILLLTDAAQLDPADIAACYDEAWNAKNHSIIVITIGLNIDPSDEEQLLIDIANITGGKYFPAPDASYFQEIYEEISVLIENETREELSDTDTCNITVRNEPPGTTLPVIFGYGEEGGPSYGVIGEAIDPGSDDLTFVWDHGDGTNETVIFYNNGVGPEPVYDPSTNEVRSPWGNFPFAISDERNHIYGDDGIYYGWILVKDDDGGMTNIAFPRPSIENVPPILSANIPKNADEGEEVLFTADGYDNGTDDLTFTWSWGDGTPDTVTTHYNNGVSPEPEYDPATNEVKSPWGTFPFTAADSITHAYGDDGVYSISLTVSDDDGGLNTYNTTITVNNVAPSITEIIIPYPAEEGIESTFRATVKDEGSDDLTFEWDFGDLTSTITNTYYNDGLAQDPYPSPGGTYPFIAQDTLNHTYGDDYNYNFTLTVTDDDGGVTTFTTTVIVQNVAPTIEPFGPFTINEGSPFDTTAISTDPGSDDLTFTWEFELGPTITKTYYNDGGGPDPYPSPWGTYPYSATDTAEHTYGDDGNFTVILTVTDDDGGTAVYETYILVNNVPPSISSINYTSAIINEPRTIGYWGHQCEVEKPYGDHTGILQEWVDNISSQSQVFSWISTKEDVCSVVQQGDASDMIVMAKRQLMGVWLNIVSGKLQPDSEIYMPNLTSSNTIWEAVQEIEYAILYSSDREELERVKNIADNMNNGIGIAIAHVDFVATASDPGADDLTFHWDFGDGKNQTNHYPNPNGTFPVEVTDHVGHSYFSYGTFTVTLTVTDDDGGLDMVVVIIII